ncbi:MAG: metal ABC transporter permease [SAR324 cluster bacterium]|nr:metal ABC transporter permease [SAR324 cluster bacterium]
MIYWLMEPWAFSFMQTAVTMAVLLGFLGGMAGSIVVTQRSALQVESLAHALLPGLVIAYLWMGRSTWSLLIGGIFAVILTRLLSLVFSFHQRTDHTTGSAIIIGFNFSLGLLLYHIYRNQLPISLDHFILGDLLAVSWTDNWFAMAVVLSLFLLLLFFYSPIKAFLFDPDYTARRGWPILTARTILEVVISIATILSFQSVGLILTLAILIVPAATIQMVARHLWQMFVFGGLLGAFEGVAGLSISYYLNWPSTPPIVMLSVAIYTLVLAQKIWKEKAK